jgi:hypothetical protein
VVKSVSFSGGDKLTKRLKEIAKGVSQPAALKVGFLEGSTYPDDKGTPTAAVAAWQEFGTPTIPKRPFFRNMIQENSYRWGPNVGTALKSTDYDAVTALSLMGIELRDELQDSIREGDFAPLSPITVMLRGMKYNDPSLVVTGATVGEAARRVGLGLTNYGAPTKPLIDTSHMINSVDFKVDQGANS